jgi:hypothetical protein
MSIQTSRETSTNTWSRTARVIAFVVVSVVVPVLLWPEGGQTQDSLRVFLMVWSGCGLLLAGVTLGSALGLRSVVSAALLWFGLGVLVGVGVGTIPWTDLGREPMWQLWLTLFLGAGYLTGISQHGIRQQAPR